MPNYICPICEKVFKGNRAMANHIISNCKVSQKHADWIQARGVDYRQHTDLKKGKMHQALIDIIIKDCKRFITAACLIWANAQLLFQVVE